MDRKREGSGATRLIQKGEWHRDALVIDAPAEDIVSLDADHFGFQATPKGVERPGGLAPPPASCWLAYLPKGNERRDYLLALAAQCCERFQCVGLTRGGIKSAKKAMKKHFAEVRTVAVGFHHQLLEGNGPSGIAATLDETQWSTGLGFDAVSLPGTFAAGRLDEGTKRFADALPQSSWKDFMVLDLACGSGVLGVHLARAGANVSMTDIDYLACEAARRTATLAGVTTDVYPSWAYDIGLPKFDRIVTNPPFHEGSQTSFTAAEAFVYGAPAHLRKDGELWLVANHFLPYEGWLEASFGSFEKIHEDKHFKVLRARLGA